MLQLSKVKIKEHFLKLTGILNEDYEHDSYIENAAQFMESRITHRLLSETEVDRCEYAAAVCAVYDYILARNLGEKIFITQDGRAVYDYKDEGSISAAYELKKSVLQSISSIIDKENFKFSAIGGWYNFMVINVKNAIKDYLESININFFEDYSTVNTLDYANKIMTFFNIDNIEVSQYVASFDGSIYGAEVKGHMLLRVLGVRHSRDGEDELNKCIDKIITKLCYAPNILVTSIKRDEIFYNKVLGRHESRVYIDFKNYIQNDIK